MSQIILGGQKYNVGGKTDWAYNRMMTIMNRKPEELYAFVSATPDAKVSDADIVRGIISGSHLDDLCVHVYGRLHDLIAREYIMIIDDWVQKNQLKALEMDFAEGSEPQPPNYTPAMTRLKNISWRGYKPNFGGFCVKEPVVRILQLADYPIGVFRDVTIGQEEVKTPTKPAAPEGKAQIYKTPKDLYTRILELRKKVIEWEDYYTHMCESIEMVCRKLESELK